jgi:hypothetical protein
MPMGSDASSSTLLGSPPPAAEPSYTSNKRDLLLPGHSDTRAADGWCIIQCGTAIDEAEEALRYSLAAMVTDASRDLISSDAIYATVNIHGVKEGTFSIVPLFLDHFIIHCCS